MTEADIFTQEDKEQAKGCDNLGPHYFAARRFAEQMMKDSSFDDLKPIIEEVGNKLYAKIQDSFENFLLNDAEINVQNHIWQTVDEIVKGILTGEKWVVDQYALAEHYPCDKIRAALFAAAPEELRGLRVVELEKTVKELRDDNARLRQRYG